MTGPSDACTLVRQMNESPDVLPTLVFRSTDRGDMQASSRSRKESTAELIHQHLKALATFSDADLEEALDSDNN